MISRPKWFNGLTIVYLFLATCLIVVTGLGAKHLGDYIAAPYWGRWIAFCIMAAFFWFALKLLNILEKRMKLRFAKRKAKLVAKGDAINQKREDLVKLHEELENLPEVEISNATRERLQKRISSIKAGNHRPFDPSELDD